MSAELNPDLNPELDPERWERVQSIFAQAADLQPGARHSFVEDMCAGDALLANSVFEMLEADAEAGSLLDEDSGPAIGRIADATLRSDHLRSLVQRQIGPYRLLRVLGEGGMGIVYLAERTDIGGLVAIKLLRDAWMSPMRRERFVLEQQTLVKLNHPAIARLYDASTMEDGTPWFVMEYADGQPLTQYLAARGGSVRDDLLLFRRVCEAVQYAHGHAIIHRDLKPSNILVTTEGEVKLLDFGIAKQMLPEASTGERTVAGLRLLTPGYAAPEQHTGGDVGVFTDIYSLGVLLYEILTGKLPDPEEARAGRLPEKPSALARTAGSKASRLQLSKQEFADLDVLCLTALQPEPERRYRSADAFIRDITAYLEERVLEARPNSIGYTVRKFAGRNRLPLASLAAVLLLVVGGTLFFTVRLARARNAAVAEARRTERIQDFMLDMLGNADQEAAPSNDLKVVTLLDRAAQQAATLKDDADTQTELYQIVGSMYNRLGKFEQAEGLLTHALDSSKRSNKAVNPKTAEVLVQLGTVRGDLGNVKDAQKDIEDALKLAAAAGLPIDDSTVVQAHIALGRVETQGGEYQKAIDQFTSIIRMASTQSGDRRYDLRDSEAYLAVAATNAAQYDIAEAASRRAIAIDKELIGEQHVQTALDLINLATVKMQQGDLSAAEQLYREGLPIMQDWYGPDHPDVASCSTVFARLLIAEQKPAEAEPLLLHALPIQEKTYGPVHMRVAFTLDSLGTVALRKDDLPTAEADFARAVAVYRSTIGDADPHTAVPLGNLGAVYLKEGKYALAEAALRQAVEILKHLPPGNNVIGVARGRWGRSLLALKRYPEAREQLTEALDLLNAQRTPPPIDVANVRSDLAALDVATHRSGKAILHQTELADKVAPPVSH